MVSFVQNSPQNKGNHASVINIYSGHARKKLVRYMAVYWAIQVGLLTPLTFARHRLSPLAALTSGVYFLHNGRR